MHDQWRSQVEAIANARFETSQARIRPHFLFNSMNTIASLNQTDLRLAEEVVEDLADLFRASLATDDSVSTLADERDLMRRYLNIERHRLGSRLRLHREVYEAVPDNHDHDDSPRRSNQMASERVRPRMDGMFEGRAQVAHSRVEDDYEIKPVFPYPRRTA
jgi:two-component system sensor histidine kinase AlgZ